MRTLKYAILGLLNRKPMTGYDISKEFNFQLAEFWSAKHSQIYPELKKLVSEELIIFKIEISGDVLEKKVYYILIFSCKKREIVYNRKVCTKHTCGR